MRHQIRRLRNALQSIFDRVFRDARNDIANQLAPIPICNRFVVVLFNFQFGGNGNDCRVTQRHWVEANWIMPWLPTA
jgi:hypothetical protein